MLSRRAVIHTMPQVTADSGQGITEGSFLFGIPTGLSEWERVRVQYHCHQHDQAENTKQARGGALNGLVRPLALGFEAQMSPHFFEGDFDVPTSNEPRDDLCG